MTSKTTIFLLILGFITFGIGDALTATWMIILKGSSIEANIMFKYIFDAYGTGTFIAVKLIFTVIVLSMVYAILIKATYNCEWTINGWLTALSIGGILACIMNLSVIMDFNFIGSKAILILYLALTGALTLTGDIIDTRLNPTNEQP